MVSPHVLNVVVEATRSHLITPVILAETLNGLDYFVRGESDIHRASPYLLYLWLKERFSLISVLEQELLADPCQFFPMYDYPIFAGLSSIDWPERLAESFKLIRWSVPWWGLRAMVITMGGQNYVCFRCLRYTSFYILDRSTRQFSVPLDYPLPLRNLSSTARPITPRLAETLHGLWTIR